MSDIFKLNFGLVGLCTFDLLEIERVYERVHAPSLADVQFSGWPKVKFTRSTAWLAQAAASRIDECKVDSDQALLLLR